MIATSRRIVQSLPASIGELSVKILWSTSVASEFGGLAIAAALAVAPSVAASYESAPIATSSPGAASAPATASSQGNSSTDAAVNLPQRVEIVAPSSLDDRRDANASKITVSRDDLTRFGDTNLADSLRRIPGVTVVNAPGKAAEIRLRGLGNGYTQILVDGQPVPNGFSMESLAPDLIDHVEILRSATADLAGQGMAGTINILMRRPRNSPAQLKFAIGSTAGQATSSASIDASGNSGLWSWNLGGSFTLAHSVWHSNLDTYGISSTNEYEYLTDTRERQRKFTTGIAPQINWKSASGGSTFDLSGLLQVGQTSYRDFDLRSPLTGTPPDFASSIFTSANESRLARMTLRWKTTIGEAGRLDSKFILSSGRSNLDAQVNDFSAAADPLLVRVVHSTAQDDSGIASSKYSLKVNGSHSLSVGWDGQAGTRSEHRLQDESSPVGFPTLNLDEGYTARITRVAVYAQDEWAHSDAVSAYVGLRWEGLNTRTAGDNLQPVDVSASVLSPTAQVILKIPNTKADQIRISLGRTYKAPTTRDLVPRLWQVNQNGPTTPDFRGNPSLRPELSWGLDLSYERYLPHDGLVSLNTYARRIKGVVLQHVYEENSTWLQSPINGTTATVVGVEFEVKGPLRTLVPTGPNVVLRLGATRNWSSVDGVPGPGNRLGGQSPYTGTVGADWRLTGPVTFGLSFVFERGGYARTSVEDSMISSDKRLLDFNVLWQVGASTQLRFTVTNALALHESRKDLYRNSTVDETLTTRRSTAALARLQLEMRF